MTGFRQQLSATGIQRSLYEPLFLDDYSMDTDDWDGGDDNPGRFGALSTDIHSQINCTSGQHSIIVCNNDMVAEKRQLRIQPVQEHGEYAYIELIY